MISQGVHSSASRQDALQSASWNVSDPSDTPAPLPLLDPPQVLDLLADIKDKFDVKSGALSWADLIVLAGNTALEEAGEFDGEVGVVHSPLA